MLLLRLMLWMDSLQTRPRDERGITATEYVLLGALILGFVVAAANGVGGKIMELVDRIPT